MPKHYRLTVCRHCGTKFKQMGKSGYCSEECREAYLRDLKIKNYGYTKCGWCGKEYVRRNKNQKYCCDRCLRDAENMMVRTRSRVQEECKVMVIDVIPVYPHLCPKVGSVHDAVEYTLPHGSKGCWIEMSGKRIALRQGEYRRIDDG